jgi:hypothetical protein
VAIKGIYNDGIAFFFENALLVFNPAAGPLLIGFSLLAAVFHRTTFYEMFQ